MSYSITDAGEDEMHAELKALDKLNEDIDQLSLRRAGLHNAGPGKWPPPWIWRGTSRKPRSATLVAVRADT